MYLGHILLSLNPDVHRKKTPLQACWNRCQPCFIAAGSEFFFFWDELRRENTEQATRGAESSPAKNGKPRTPWRPWVYSQKDEASPSLTHLFPQSYDFNSQLTWFKNRGSEYFHGLCFVFKLDVWWRAKQQGPIKQGTARALGETLDPCLEKHCMDIQRVFQDWGKVWQSRTFWACVILPCSSLGCLRFLFYLVKLQHFACMCMRMCFCTWDPWTVCKCQTMLSLQASDSLGRQEWLLTPPKAKYTHLHMKLPSSHVHTHQVTVMWHFIWQVSN